MTKNQEKQIMNLLNNCITGIEDLREGQKRLETDVSELKSDVSELKSDMTEVKSDVSTLKSDVSELKSDVSELKDGQKRIENKLELNERATNTLAGEHIRMKERLHDLERPQA